MKQIKRTNVKFKEYAMNQLMLIPPSLEEMIDANHPVRIVNQVIDQIDLDSFLQSLKEEVSPTYSLKK